MYRSNRTAGVAIVIISVLAGAVMLSTVGTAVSARPPPQAVCGVCSDTLVDAAAENGVAIDVAEGALAIRVDRSGTGHWTAQVTLTGAGVEKIRAKQALRDQLVQRVYERGSVAVEEPQSLTTSMTGNTLLVEYEVPGMATERMGGVYVVDFFYWHGGEARWFYLAADSMTMRGPPGTVVSHAPADAMAGDHTVTWTASDQQYDPLDDRSHVAFAPTHGVPSRAATAFGIGVDVAQLKAQDIAGVGMPLALFIGMIALLRRFGHRLATLSRLRLMAVVSGPLVAVGLSAATVETLVGVAGPISEQVGDFLFYLLYTLAATGAGPTLVLGGPLVAGQLLLARGLLEGNVGPTGINRNEAVNRLLVWPTAAILASQWLLFPVAAVGPAGYDTAYGLVSLVLPMVYVVPLAVTRQCEGSRHIAFTVGFVLAPVPVVFALAPYTGMAFLRTAIALRYVPWALIVAAVGLFAYASAHRIVATDVHSGG